VSLKVLVIVRTKNRPVLLERALASVAAQTWSDVVPVVVNDGGDPTAVDEAVAASGVADVAIVVHHETSRGRSAALNAGLAATQADAFAIHDDDDTWDPSFLTETVHWLEGNPDAVAVATRTEVVYEQWADGQYVEVGRELLAGDTREVTLLQTAWHNYVPPIALVVRSSVVDRIGLFDTTLPVLEDWDFNLRLLTIGPIGFLPDQPLAFWRHRKEAAGPEGNSVVAEAGDHETYDQLIRDMYLRRDLAGEGNGLGFHLAVTRVLRRMNQDADRHWAHHSRFVDQWHQSHRAHLDAVGTDLSLEVGRLRGEVLAMRESVTRLEVALAESHERLRREIRQDAKPVRQGLRRLSRRVDDLWQADKGVARLVRNRERDAR
jgi:glycosyltransferase involved in cell wall biosynthesis